MDYNFLGVAFFDDDLPLGIIERLADKTEELQDKKRNVRLSHKGGKTNYGKIKKTALEKIHVAIPKF